MSEKLKNSRTTISASEINRFTYCNYQWYYERLYGSKQLRELKGERNKKIGVENTYSNFKRGTNFHNEGYRKMMARRKLIRVCIIAIVIIILCTFIYFKVRQGV